MADFQRRTTEFEEIGAAVLALSSDSLEHARETRERQELAFPVLYGLDAREMAASIGAYVNEDPPFLHATGFVLEPGETVAQAVYSSGPIGRLVASDTLSFIRHRQTG